MAQDVITLIIRDHREMVQLFDRLRAEEENRAGLVRLFGPLLIAHHRAEEEHLYPELAKAAAAERDEAHHSAEEHAVAEKLLRQLQGTDPRSAEFTTVLDQLADVVTGHVEREESTILPSLAKAVGRDRLGELGYHFAERRAQKLAQVAAESGLGARRAKEIAREIGDEQG